MRPPSVVVVVITLLYSLAFTVSGPIVAATTKRLTAAGAASDFPVTYGFVSACYHIAKAVGAPVIGHLSDVLGRRRVLMVTTLLTGLCFSCMPRTSTLLQFVALRLCTGVLSGNGTLVLAYITDNSTPTSRPRLLNMFNWMWNLSTVLGGASVYFIQGDAQLACDSALVCMLAASVATLYLMDDVRHPMLECNSGNQPNSFRLLAGLRSMYTSLLELFANPLTGKLFVLQALTPHFDIGPILLSTTSQLRSQVDTQSTGSVATASAIKSASSLCAIAVPAFPLTRWCQATGLSSAALAGAGCVASAFSTLYVARMLAAATSSSVGDGSVHNMTHLVAACALREAVVTVFRPFQTDAQLSKSRSKRSSTTRTRGESNSGATAGWRECLKSGSYACSSVTTGYACALLDTPNAPLYVCACALLAQALAYWQYSVRTEKQLGEHHNS